MIETSIYNIGGGGGGYKDGGALVDGEFIKVENNTVSSYENVNRDPINLYFELNDGEILNSVVELTTSVNATVNVYAVNDGLFYLLGYIGGNTVNAGNDYKINIVGHSYSIEQVSGFNLVPEYAEINGTKYSVCKIQNKLVISENYRGPFKGDTKIFNGSIPNYPESIVDGCGTIIFNGNYFYRLAGSTVYDLENYIFLDNLNNPWKVFNNKDFSDFSNDEITAFNVQKLGYIDTQVSGGHLVATQNMDPNKMHVGILSGMVTPNRSVSIDDYDLNHGLTGSGMANNEFVNIRLYRDL